MTQKVIFIVCSFFFFGCTTFIPKTVNYTADEREVIRKIVDQEWQKVFDTKYTVPDLPIKVVPWYQLGAVDNCDTTRSVLGCYRHADKEIVLSDDLENTCKTLVHEYVHEQSQHMFGYIPEPDTHAMTSVWGKDGVLKKAQKRACK